MTKIIYRSTFFILISILFACSSNVSKIDISKNPVFPLPPDKPRIQYLTNISNSMNVTEKYSFWEELFFGEQRELPILKPFNIYVYQSKIYVCDLRLNSIDIIDLKKKSFEYFLPKGQAVFKSPMGIAVDSSGMYVSDAVRADILKFNHNGDFVKSFALDLAGRIIALDIDKENLYGVDIKNRKVHIFDKETNSLKRSFPDYNKDDSTAFLYQPTHIKVKNNKIFVTDVGADQIKVYTLDGAYIKSIGTIGNSPGQFTRPKGIEVDNDENLYAIDAAFENVQIFNKESKILMAFGGAYKGPGYMYLPFGIAIDYNNIEYFKDYIDPKFKIKYLIYVTNQFGPEKITVYGLIDYD
jgi:hypothetical protein